MIKRLICIAVLLGIAMPAWAGTTPQFPTTLSNGKTNFVQGTDAAGTFKTLYTAGASGSQCYAISVSNDDSGATHLMTFEIVNSAVNYGHWTATTTSPSGVTTPFGPYFSQAALNASTTPGQATDGKGNNILQLVNGDVLKVTYSTAFSLASSEIDVVATCWDF